MTWWQTILAWVGGISLGVSGACVALAVACRVHDRVDERRLGRQVADEAEQWLRERV